MYASGKARNGEGRRFGLKEDGSKQKMAVWAFNRTFDESHRLWKRDGAGEDSDEPIPFEIVTIPYSTNANAQAQQAVFTVVKCEFGSGCVDRKPLDQILYGYLERNAPHVLKANVEAVPLFIRFELPWGEVRELVRGLAKAGVNASTVFPGYGGVVKGARERLWWWD